MYCIRLIISISLAFASLDLMAQDLSVESPDKRLRVDIFLDGGKATYTVGYDGMSILQRSPLGLTTNEGDFNQNLIYVGSERGKIDKQYEQDRIKQSSIYYKANTLKTILKRPDEKEISIVFQVSNNDIAFRYELPMWKDRGSVVVEGEATGYRFPAKATSYLSSVMTPMTGFARTAPSYESGYSADAPILEAKGKTGYVFPALFKIGEDGWVLLSETGVTSLYCASHLSPISTDGLFHVAYPDIKENNGFGSTGAALSLPAVTPWRTITVGQDLKPIVETTIPFDVVEPLYEASTAYRFGKSTWSWIVWQDNSMNWDDQVKYIDLASSLGYEYILIDALWDTNIGRDRIKDLIAYANSKEVDVFLWYNSNGSANDAPQGPRNRMNTSIVRKHEMKWLQDIGVKGLKVDFFGGDKQETMRMYEDILSDANNYGLMIIFHGATLPRGWERMYPNFVGSEAVIASEMLIFSQHARENEAFYATLHPFIRNAVGSMEFGGVLLNKYLTRENRDRNKRLTTNGFQLATAILFQNPVQPFALTPNNLSEVPLFEIDFLKEVPTTWDETRLLAGQPGKYVVLARRHKDKWYIGGVNAQTESLKLRLRLPLSMRKNFRMITDKSDGETVLTNVAVNKSGELEVNIMPNGGVIIY